jgi:hypothetical protein
MGQVSSVKAAMTDLAVGPGIRHTPARNGGRSLARAKRMIRLVCQSFVPTCSTQLEENSHLHSGAMDAWVVVVRCGGEWSRLRQT